MDSTNSTGDDRKTEEALLIAVAVAGLMMVMIILRFGTNCLIDCCILNEPERARRDLVRTCCPWYHRRTQPAGSLNREAEMHSAAEAVPENLCKERLMNALFLFDLSAETIHECCNEAPSRNISGTSDPDEEAPTQEDHSNGSASRTTTMMICSICIHEMIPGDTVFKTPHCHHLFHAHCICEWMTAVTRGNHTECPNCRTAIITKVALNRILVGDHESGSNL